VLAIDAILVRRHGVEVFADDPECILRAGLRRLDTLTQLPDGTKVEAGLKVIEIHFWNEHLPVIEEEGADLRWGRQFGRRLAHSLRLLAAHAQADPRYKDFAVVHGRLGFIPGNDVDLMKGLATRFGFLLELEVAPGRRFWTEPFWAGVYAWWLMWTFNPNTLRKKRFRQIALSDLWMTRETLLGRYGGDRLEVGPG
jgi:hypothetical protein